MLVFLRKWLVPVAAAQHENAAYAASLEIEKISKPNRPALVFLQSVLFTRDNMQSVISFSFKNFGCASASIATVNVDTLLSEMNDYYERAIYKEEIFVGEICLDAGKNSPRFCFSNELISQFGRQVDDDILNLNLTCHFTWIDSSENYHKEIKNLVWSSKRRSFLGGSQLWDNRARAEPDE